jgi:hypothetical protein
MDSNIELLLKESRDLRAQCQRALAEGTTLSARTRWVLSDSERALEFARWVLALPTTPPPQMECRETAEPLAADGALAPSESATPV